MGMQKASAQTYDLIASFAGTGLEGDFGGTSAMYATNPVGTDQVIKLTSNSTGQIWQGLNVNLSTNYRLTAATQLSMQLDVYSTTAITIAPKAQGGLTGAPESVTTATHNGTGWQTLTFTFNQSLDGKVPANGDYSDFALHINWNIAANTFGAADARIFYIRNLKGLPIAPPPPDFAPDQAPIPSTPNAQVLKIYGDTGGFTNTWVPAYSFGNFASKPDLDQTASVNEAIKMNFANAGYGEGTDPAVVTNVSTYGYLNFSYYVQSGTANAGSLGHQFYFDLISRIGSTNTEAFYGIGPALTTTGNPSEHVKRVIVFDSWQTVSIPLSDFVGFSPANFFQFKIGSSSDLRTKIAYFDNIYFSVNPGTLNTNNFNISKVKLYPNPTSNVLNIESVGTIQNIAIFNVLGQEVMNKSANESLLSLDVSGLNAGVYVIKTVIDGTVSSTKFIKE